jgi:hypothetical protein
MFYFVYLYHRPTKGTNRFKSLLIFTSKNRLHNKKSILNVVLRFVDLTHFKCTRSIRFSSPKKEKTNQTNRSTHFTHPTDLFAIANYLENVSYK